jgi:hypothetical protein
MAVVSTLLFGVGSLVLMAGLPPLFAPMLVRDAVPAAFRRPNR